MSFDIENVLTNMASAVSDVVSGEWSGVKECVEKALKEEKVALSEIAKARSCKNGVDSLRPMFVPSSLTPQLMSYPIPPGEITPVGNLVAATPPIGKPYP